MRAFGCSGRDLWGLTLVLLAMALAAGSARAATPLEVAYAGSMGALMERGVGPAIAQRMAAELRGRAQGSTGLAHLIIAGSIRPDVFIAITPGPMRTVLRAGKAARAMPIARTEMVLAYSPRSRFATQFAATDGRPWWRILEQPGLRFGRTDPEVDPQGLNTIFMLQLAESYYHQARLADKILGPQLNPRQIFQEPEVMARLQAGQLDASAAYKTQPAAMGLPFVTLPREINLGDAALANEYRAATVNINGKPRHPSPLVFYAAVLRDAPQPKLAARFVAWLTSAEAREIMARYHYDGPGDARPLTR
ncbi:MAG TPA: extracellular solute-binding protein [Candidatus Binataceae bacterium]|nr:extracellular solute-binding protein [Candidatus Binataceae bacterium]